jgi:hypothetical protein
LRGFGIKTGALAGIVLAERASPGSFRGKVVAVVSMAGLARSLVSEQAFTIDEQLVRPACYSFASEANVRASIGKEPNSREAIRRHP